MRLYSSRRGWRPGLAIAGCAGGLLTVWPPLPPALRGVPIDLFAGIWFGLALALYFTVRERHRSIAQAVSSIAKAVSLTAVSAAAWFLAFQATVWTAAFFFETNRGPLDLLALFFGGAVGAFIVSSVTLLLYSRDRALLAERIRECSMAGGVLGALGYALGGGLADYSGGPGRFTIAIVQLAWQTGMGFAMGLVWPDETTPMPTTVEGGNADTLRRAEQHRRLLP
jgi:hypothetical protein